MPSGPTATPEELAALAVPDAASEYHFDIGSAGSTKLFFKTVLPALLTARGD